MGASSPDFLPFCDLWTDGSVVKFSISLRRPWNGFVIVLAIAGGVKVEGLDYPEAVLLLSDITLQFYPTVHWAAMEVFLRHLCFQAKKLARKWEGCRSIGNGIWRSD